MFSLKSILTHFIICNNIHRPTILILLFNPNLCQNFGKKMKKKKKNFKQNTDRVKFFNL